MQRIILAITSGVHVQPDEMDWGNFFLYRLNSMFFSCS